MYSDFLRLGPSTRPSTFADLIIMPAGSTAMPPGPLRTRFHVTGHISTLLEQAFSMCQYPDRPSREHLARMVHASEQQIRVWFQNRRAREVRANRLEAAAVSSSSSSSTAKRALPQSSSPPPPAKIPTASAFPGSGRTMSCSAAIGRSSAATLKPKPMDKGLDSFGKSARARTYSIDCAPAELFDSLDDLDETTALDVPVEIELDEDDFAKTEATATPTSSSAARSPASPPAATEEERAPPATDERTFFLVSAHAPHVILHATPEWGDLFGFAPHETLGKVPTYDRTQSDGPLTSPTTVAAIGHAARTVRRRSPATRARSARTQHRRHSEERRRLCCRSSPHRLSCVPTCDFRRRACVRRAVRARAARSAGRGLDRPVDQLHALGPSGHAPAACRAAVRPNGRGALRAALLHTRPDARAIPDRARAVPRRRQLKRAPDRVRRADARAAHLGPVPQRHARHVRARVKRGDRRALEYSGSAGSVFAQRSARVAYGETGDPHIQIVLLWLRDPRRSV